MRIYRKTEQKVFFCSTGVRQKREYIKDEALLTNLMFSSTSLLGALHLIIYRHLSRSYFNPLCRKTDGKFCQNIRSAVFHIFSPELQLSHEFSLVLTGLFISLNVKPFQTARKETEDFLLLIAFENCFHSV